MKVDVTSLDVGLSQVLRGKVARRVGLALDPFGPRIRRVTVRLAESTDPRGVVTRRCRLRVWLKGHRDVHVDAVDAGFEAAADRAAAKLAQRLAAALDRPAPAHSG